MLVKNGANKYVSRRRRLHNDTFCRHTKPALTLQVNFIDNSENEHGSYDSKILDVVTVILEEFFSQEPTVMLYICDSTDHRQAARDRLYHLWFYDYARSHEMTLYSDSVTFKQVNYYAGILMRHDHPLHDMILSYYQDFLKHVPQLYTPREK